jgi:hypothetical protein
MHCPQTHYQVLQKVLKARLCHVLQKGTKATKFGPQVLRAVPIGEAKARL